jgi:anti-anti-sigma factor
MKIEVARAAGSASVRLGGRLDREWSEHLSSALEELVRQGVRSLVIDLQDVTYISSAATKVLARWQQELAALRGDVKLISVSPAVVETLAMVGWNGEARPAGIFGSGQPDLRQSSWQHGITGFASCGQFEMSARDPKGALRCRVYGDPQRLRQSPLAADDCHVVELTEASFGFGLGAIGNGYEECRDRIGELVAVAGSVAYYPSDGARLPDYLVGEGSVAPRTLLASGVMCEGGFSKLVRFSPREAAESIPLSELAAVCLDAVGGRLAGLVIAGESPGLSATRLKRSPGATALQLELPEVSEWLSFAPERVHPMTTALITGIVARTAEGPLAAHLRPVGALGQLHGHFHAAVFSYHPLPQRTVELAALVKGLFANHQLRDVLHLLWDDRHDDRVVESALVRGVAWAAPITDIS